jgi:hypothetical protein
MDQQINTETHVWTAKWRNPFFAAEDLCKEIAALQEKGIEPDKITFKTTQDGFWQLAIQWQQGA